MEEPVSTVNFLYEKYKDSYACAKVALKYYLEKAEETTAGDFDPVETLRGLFHQLELHEALRYLERDLGDETSGDENDPFEIVH